MKKIITTALVLSGVVAYAQTGKVGINQEKPEATLQIDVATVNKSNDSNQGLLIPRLTKARVAAISAGNLKEGTLIYVEDANVSTTSTNTKVAQITKNGFYHYDGANWVATNVPKGTANGQVLKWNGTSWAAGADTDTNTTYTGGKAIRIESDNSVNLNQEVRWFTNKAASNYTVEASLDKHNLYIDSTVDVTITIPDNLPVGFSAIFIRENDKEVTFTGNHLQSSNGKKIRAKYSAVGILKIKENVVVLTGDTAN